MWGALAACCWTENVRLGDGEGRGARAQLKAEARAERLAGLVHLSSGLAHEIRNPLGGIQGAIEILAEAVPADDSRREMVQVGLKETDRLGRVLDEFLTFARPSEPEPVVFDATEISRHVVQLLKLEADVRSIQVDLQGDKAAYVNADPEQITQVLVNLVRNALQIIPTGGRVVLSCRQLEAGRGKDHQIKLSVADTGPGVDEALGESIYHPYVSTREGGTGLGLAISALLVRQNGGVLGHENRPDGGAIFRFSLPAAYRRSP